MVYHLDHGDPAGVVFAQTCILICFPVELFVAEIQRQAPGPVPLHDRFLLNIARVSWVGYSLRLGILKRSTRRTDYDPSGN